MRRIDGPARWLPPLAAGAGPIDQFLVRERERVRYRRLLRAVVACDLHGNVPILIAKGIGTLWRSRTRYEASPSALAIANQGMSRLDEH